MSKIKLAYIKSYRDRHGQWRHYFNRRGSPRDAWPGWPGSAEFMEAYQIPLGGRAAQRPPERPPRRNIEEGSMAALAAAYYASAGFRNLATSTQATYRNIVERIVAEHGDKPVALLDRKGVKNLINARADRPGAANAYLKTLRILMRFAVDEEMRSDDPTALIKRLKTKGDGFTAWTDEDIAKFEGRHPIGTRARLALALLLYTAQRRGDVVRMGRQHVRGDRIMVRQNKTGSTVEIPIHPDLAEILRLAPVGTETFLMTEFGKPFAAAGFGNWFRSCCSDAGLPLGYNAHGLRKAAARRLAEAGCTTLEIMAITGHREIEEVERYTRSANQRNLATVAIDKLQRSNR